ncbi:MAG: tryptophan--tRNA ligase [Patescibacteria group bacterium]|nr:tryptophan--tRNA ligase [Patescibacteria group bacterium]
MIRKRILTGDRPTGKLHLGHYVGSLANRAKLQDEYETYILIADVQALTDNFAHPEKVRENVREVLLDNLAVGIDPEKATFHIQSMIPETAELTVFFANLVTVSRLERNPTVKDEIAQRGFNKSLPLGFFMYPVSQAADIAVVRANLVPVGADQIPHVEQTREIVREFNRVYGGNIFPEPEALLGKVKRLAGTDGGAKMSKSLGNVIYLSDDAEEVKSKVMAMYTDPTRIHPNDPGHVEGNPVFEYHKAFNKNQAEVRDLEERYQKGKVGDVEVKERLALALNEFLDPIREKRCEYESKGPKYLDEILLEGTKKARQVTQETLKMVRSAMKIDYF